MKNIVVVLFFIFCYGISTVSAQTALETAVKESKMDVTLNIPSCFNVSQNEKMIYVTEVTDKDPLPTLAQTYRSKPAYGNTAFKVFFGMIHSIIEHKDGEYLFFVLVSPLRSKGKMTEISFERIKEDFRYGSSLKAPSDQDEYMLNLKLTYYPKEQSLKMFNANIMATYPFDLEGNVYRDKYTKCRAVVIKNNGFEIYLYFMMTDENEKIFDTYLNDLEKAFWFN